MDGGLPAAAATVLEPLIVYDSSARQYSVQETNDRDMTLLNAVFGFAAGQALGPFGGLNEYLSAMLAVTQLHAFLSHVQLLQVAMCIEATIPFRKPDAAGREWSDRLFERSLQYAQDHALGLSEADITAAVHRAVKLANSDVGGFSAVDTKFFLRNTWNLLPESNPNLRKPGSYTLKVCSRGSAARAHRPRSTGCRCSSRCAFCAVLIRPPCSTATRARGCGWICTWFNGMQGRPPRPNGTNGSSRRPATCPCPCCT